MKKDKRDDANPKNAAITLADFDQREKRRCTDIFFLLLIILHWFALTGIGIYSIIEGDYKTVIYPMDYSGNICGTNYGDIDMVEFPFLYPVNFYSAGVCIKECPKIEAYIDPFTLVTYGGLYQPPGSLLPPANAIEIADYSQGEYYRECNERTCFPESNPIKAWTSDGVNEGSGFAFFAVDTSEYMKRCVISRNALGLLVNITKDIGSNEMATSDLKETASDLFGRFFPDIYTARNFIFGFGFGISLALSFLYSFLLRIPVFIPILVWSCIIIVFSLFIGSGTYTYLEYAGWKIDLSNVTNLEFSIKDQFGWNTTITNDWDGVNFDFDSLDVITQTHSKSDIQGLQWFSYLCFICAGLWFLLVCFLRKRIQLAIGIVKESAKVVNAMPTLILSPIVQCLATVFFTLIWIVYAVHLSSLGELVPSEVIFNNVTITFRTFSYDTEMKQAGWFLLFSFFWTSQFIVALGQIFQSLAVSKWYFTRNKSNVGNGTVITSMYQTLLYHSGTAAFGSLLIAVVQVWRVSLMYLQKQLAGRESKPLKIILSCLSCCMWCLEKFLKFINKNAYIQTAIFGTSFCTSSRNAFFLILRNAARIGAVSVIGEFITLVGKFFICVATGASAYFAIDHMLGSEVHSPIAPVIFIVIISYFVGSMFMEVFRMTMSTLIQCFIADEELFEAKDECFAESDLKEWISKNSSTKSKVQIAASPS